MPKPYPKEFRQDVVRVARNREPGQTLKQIAADFGISESCLAGWIKADIPQCMSEPLPASLLSVTESGQQKGAGR